MCYLEYHAQRSERVSARTRTWFVLIYFHIFGM